MCLIPSLSLFTLVFTLPCLCRLLLLLSAAISRPPPFCLHRHSLFTSADDTQPCIRKMNYFFTEMPPALLLLFVAIHLGGTFRTTICDCKNPTKTGLMQFASTKCSPQPLPHNFKPVTYDVFSTQHQAAKFPAVICARWKNVKQITMNFFAQTVVVPQTIPLETSAIECRIMQQGRRCNDQPMTIVDRKWIYNQEPSDGGSWLSTITEETIACTLEEEHYK